MLSNEPMCLEPYTFDTNRLDHGFQCSLTSRCVWNYTGNALTTAGSQFQCSLTSRCVWNVPVIPVVQDTVDVSMLSNEPMCLELQRAQLPGADIEFQCSLTSRCVWNRLVNANLAGAHLGFNAL